MKKYILILALVAICFSGFAQKRKVLNLSTYDNNKFHFGFTLGFNSIDYRLDFHAPIGDNPDFSSNPIWENDANQILPSDTIRADINSLQPGFSVAIVTDLRLGKHFNLRFLPGLSFGERQLVYSQNDEYLPILNIYSGSQDNRYVSIKSTYLDFPLLIKYKSERLNNYRTYLIGGLAYRIDVSKTGEEDLINLSGGSMFAEVGIGLDQYLPFFKLSTELKFSFGLNNLIAAPPSEQRAYYAQSIRSISSNVITLSFHFE